MKKLLQTIAIVLALTISAAAAARTVIFQESAGAGWEEPDGLKQTLLKEGLLKGDAFPVVVLAQIAHKHVKEKKLPGADMTTEDYNAAFGMFNEVDTNSYISVAEFRRKGQAGQFILPDVKVVADAKASAQTPTTLVPAAAAPQVQTPSAPVVTAENVRKQLEELSKTVDGKYSGINRRVAELQAGLKKAALKDDIAKIVKETQTIIDLTNRVKVVEDRINHPETGLNAINGKAQTAFNMAQSASEGVDGLAKQFDVVWVGMVAVGLIALLAIGFGFVAMRRAATAVETATRANRVSPTLSL